jgi:esterase/lipase
MTQVKFNSLGHNLVGEINIPKKSGRIPAVLLFHGLTNSKNDCPLINETSDLLFKNGFITFRFDFFGSGQSPGEMKDKTIGILLQNAKDAIKYLVKNKRVSNIGLWGRSLGGTIVCLIPPNKKIKTRVSASGACFLEGIFKKNFAQLKKKERKLEKIGRKLPGTGQYKGKFEFKKAWFKSLDGLDKKIVKNLKKLDTMLVLGTTPDQKVSLNNACHIINALQEPKKIKIYESVGHDYKGAEGKAVKESVVWFKKYLQPLNNHLLCFPWSTSFFGFF